ncbi:hypothetical protein OSTOST_19212, partial [Ostertagia ostertagi]
GGYRPRRVSISQYEQLSAAAAEGLKRESSKSSGAIGVKVPHHYRAKTPTTAQSKAEHSVISPASSIGVSPPLRSPPRSYDTTLPSPHTRTVSSPPPVIPSSFETFAHYIFGELRKGKRTDCHPLWVVYSSAGHYIHRDLKRKSSELPSTSCISADLFGRSFQQL